MLLDARDASAVEECAGVWRPARFGALAGRNQTEALESEVYRLARGSGPLRRALSRVAGRLVATRGWERLGSARLADYARERAGISARELRDLAAVDRSLAVLPQLDRAFLAGELGWTQLRLACRVAHPADEHEWLALASQQSAPALAREVRRVDRCARGVLAEADPLDEADGRRIGVVVRCTPQVRARWWHARQIAHRVAGHTLSMAAFAEAVTAEVLSAVGLEDAREGAEPVLPHAAVRAADPGDSSSAALSRRAGPALDPTPLGSPADETISSLVDGLTRDLADADAFELDARLRRALRLEARRIARLAERLARAVLLGIPRAIGYASLDAYAKERLGMAPSRVRALLRIARTAADCAPLRAAFVAGRLSWVQAHALVPLLREIGSARQRSAWVRHAERVSVRRLCDDVERALATGSFAAPAVSKSADLQIGAIAHAVPGQAAHVRLFFAAPPEVAQLFRAALATVQRRLEICTNVPASQSEALGEMLAHAVATWTSHDPRERAAARDRRVFERDGWRCTVPGCSSYRNLHGHHIVFRSRRGSDALANSACARVACRCSPTAPERSG